MRFDADTHPNSELTGKIIACAQTVHRALRPGLDEKIYERALCIELAEQGIDFSQQERFPIHYRGQFLGNLIPDLIVANAVVVETKVVETFNGAHISQVLGYLNITDHDVGLLLNFKHASLNVKRVANLRNNQSKSA